MGDEVKREKLLVVFVVSRSPFCCSLTMQKPTRFGAMLIMSIMKPTEQKYFSTWFDPNRGLPLIPKNIRGKVMQPTRHRNMGQRLFCTFWVPTNAAYFTTVRSGSSFRGLGFDAGTQCFVPSLPAPGPTAAPDASLPSPPFTKTFCIFTDASSPFLGVVSGKSISLSTSSGTSSVNLNISFPVNPTLHMAMSSCRAMDSFDGVRHHAPSMSSPMLMNDLPSLRSRRILRRGTNAYLTAMTIWRTTRTIKGMYKWENGRMEDSG